MNGRTGSWPRHALRGVAGQITTAPSPGRELPEMGQLLQTMFEELSSWRNLLLAYSKAAKGKRGQAGAAAFEYRLEDNLLHIPRELRLQSYQPGGYASFLIHDPKRRLISAAPFRDRVVHHALCSAIDRSLSAVLSRTATPTGLAKGHIAPATAASSTRASSAMSCRSTCASSFPASTTPSCFRS